MASPSVLIVGAGISGLASAHALRDAGITARIVDRGRVPGGRMATRRLDDRPVDLGAAYFTAEPGSAFDAVVQDWVSRGLARPWTDTLAVAGPDGIHDSSTGPMRYAAPAGLRHLLVDLAEPLGVEQQQAVSAVAAREDGADVDGTRYDAVVLAMPDPQARRLLEPGSSAHDRLDDGGGWDATIAVVARWASRQWEDDLHAAFVNDSPVVGFLADDGDRRGDRAPVLVAHSTAELARRHLDEPDGAIAPVVDATMAILGITARPTSTFAHRWSFARPSAPHPEPFLLEGPIGVCGDGWGGRSSVGAAWTSGDALGRELAARLRA